MDKQLIDELNKALKDFLREKDFELVDIVYRYEANKIILRILVDRPKGGITLDECAILNNQISQLLDTGDLIKKSYILEVCSPGLDRPLRNASDFKRCVNRMVSVYMLEAIKGKTQYEGLIKQIDEDYLYLDMRVETIKIPLDKIIKAKQLI